MDQINWLSSISKVSSLIAEINDLLRNRVSVASDDDSNQNLAEAVWEEEHRWMLTVVTLYWQLVENMH